MLGLLVETNLGEDRSLQLRSKELAAVFKKEGLKEANKRIKFDCDVHDIEVGRWYEDT